MSIMKNNLLAVILVLICVLPVFTDVWATDPGRDAELVSAVKMGDLVSIESLIDNGADVNTKGLFNDRTPLYWAISNGDTAIIKFLLDHNADVNAIETQNRYGEIITQEHRELPRVQDIEAIQPGMSMLMIAVEKGIIDNIKILLDKGAEINWKNRMGWTALRQAVLGNKIEVVKLLIEKGADVNRIVSYDGVSELEWAIRRNYVDIEKLILEKVVNVRILNNSLIIAAYQNNNERTKSLINKGAEINEVLITIVEKYIDNIAQVDLLIANGADVNTSRLSRYGKETVLYYAVHHNNTALVNLLIKHGADVDCALPAPNLLEIVKVLIENGKSVDAKYLNAYSYTKPKITAMEHAVDIYNLEIMQYLIDRGANINIKDEIGQSLLIRAMKEAFCSTYAEFYEKEAVSEDKLIEQLKLLLVNGVDARAKDKRGMTALDIAKEMKKNKVAVFLEDWIMTNK